MSIYDDTLRRGLVAIYVGGGAQADRARVVVDLGCHAAEEAIGRLFKIVETATDVPERLQALEIAAQLLAARLDSVLERQREAARKLGAVVLTTSVSVPA